MLSLLTKYRERMQHQHGWEVELKCLSCGTTGIPTFNGWTPDMSMNFGNAPTIYGILHCSTCGADLKGAAREKLPELFADVTVPARNRRLMLGFVLFFIGFVAFLVAGVFLFIVVGWKISAFLMPPLMILAAGARFWFNYQIASMRYQCECGNPAYKFMGLLGRSYCYRCSSCGKLLRLRD